MDGVISPGIQNRVKFFNSINSQETKLPAPKPSLPNLKTDSNKNANKINMTVPLQPNLQIKPRTIVASKTSAFRPPPPLPRSRTKPEIAKLQQNIIKIEEKKTVPKPPIKTVVKITNQRPDENPSKIKVLSDKICAEMLLNEIITSSSSEVTNRNQRLVNIKHPPDIVSDTNTLKHLGSEKNQKNFEVTRIRVPAASTSPETRPAFENTSNELLHPVSKNITHLDRDEIPAASAPRPPDVLTHANGRVEQNNYGLESKIMEHQATKQEINKLYVTTCNTNSDSKETSKQSMLITNKPFITHDPHTSDKLMVKRVSVTKSTKENTVDSPSLPPRSYYLDNRNNNTSGVTDEPSEMKQTDYRIQVFKPIVPEKPTKIKVEHKEGNFNLNDVKTSSLSENSHDSSLRVAEKPRRPTSLFFAQEKSDFLLKVQSSENIQEDKSSEVKHLEEISFFGIQCLKEDSFILANVSRRKKVENLNQRSDAFLEPYLQGIGDRQSPGVGAASPSPPPCRVPPFALPEPPSRSPSRESLISSTGGSDAGSEDSGESGYGLACDITLVERLARTHHIWFLPGIQRAGAFHLLQGKEEGCFVVRQSSQPHTMALSVRLPPDKGPYIEHYLIQSSEGKGVGLETSENRFDSMNALIAHYATCCDELPVQLQLPKAIREAKTRQQLSSLALLGQEFWRYSPPPSNASSPDADLVLNLNPLMSTFKAAEPSTPTSKDCNKPLRPNTLNLANRIDPVKNEPMQKLEINKMLPASLGSEIIGKTPPAPPPRWSKPSTPNNFTVTTTVTFSVNSNSPRNEQPNHVDILCDPKRMSPEGQCNSTISSKGSLRRSNEQVTSPSSILSPSSDPNSLISPDTLSPLSVTKTARQSRRTKHKVSKHYQESDILDSPSVYYKSSVGDKISDYEDLWTNESMNKSQSVNGNHHFASPDLLQHTGNIVSLNNNILSPTDSHPGSGSHHTSHCSTPILNQITNNNSNFNSPHVVSSPLSEIGNIVNNGDTPTGHAPKQSSPFYAEPADSLSQLTQNAAVPRRMFPRNLNPAPQRHSNPVHLHGVMEATTDFNGTLSSSVDNLSPKQRPRVLRKPELKVVLPPSVQPKHTDTWQIDNSWKFVGSECDVNMDSSDADYDSDWPTVPNILHISPATPNPDDNTITMQDMISKRFPDIRTSSELVTEEEICRMSAYDNVEERRIPRAPPSEVSELTEFSDPWTENSHGISTTEDDGYSDNCIRTPKIACINRSKSFKDRLDPLLSPPRVQALRNREHCGSKAGVGIHNYALELAKDQTTTFAQNIDNFISCTLESRESNPQVVMRNMRQFMSGMKNYLVKHGEKGFNIEVEKERNKLKSTEFLNLDAILEGVLHRLVVKPLKNHLQKLFLDHYTKTGAIRLLADNIQYANTRPISELAIKPKITLPSESALQAISQYIVGLQAVDSPLEKLEHLLSAIALIFNSVKTSQLTGSGRSTTLGADDFLPLFVWVLVKTNFVAAEIEAEYMWGLLHPSLLSGEGGYYLTTLSSAVHVLKNFKDSNEENVKNNLQKESVLKVVVPDELHGSILTKTLPARPHMTTKEVCKIIAHKARITNPQDYALYRLTDGEETLLADNECPQDFMNDGRHVMLAYKRIDAKIAWPRQQSN